MKLLFYCVLFFVFSFKGYSQIMTVDYILRNEVLKQDSDFIDSDKLKFYQTAVAFGFDRSEFYDAAKLKLLSSKTIYKVELYYSSYKTSDKFSQQQLNRKRLQELRKKLPTLFANNAIEWKIIEQVQNDDEDKAKKLFHGFIFYSREPYAILKNGKKTEITTKEEIDIIKSYLNVSVPLDYVSGICFEYVKICNTTVVNIPKGFKRKKIYTGLYWPKNKNKKARGKRYKTKSIWNRAKEFTEKEEPVFKTVTTEECTEKEFGVPYYRLITSIDDLTKFSLTTDSVVIKALNKNNIKNTIVVEDVTGSMYPYLAQTFKWRRLWLASSKINNFAFFNDGDDHPDGPIGNSHGVYSVVSDSIDIVENAAYSTMKKGMGGAGPENNIEAMVRAVADSKLAISNIVLIADNMAMVRDIVIVKDLLKLNIPVHVIVCGVLNKAVNYQYIDIARKTGGSLHTITEEIDFRAKLAEGAAITVGGQIFIIRKGELVLE